MKKETNLDTLQKVSNLFKVFGDLTRTRIVYCLYKKERNVTEISSILNMNQSAISHQLKLLKDNRIIKSRKNGKAVYYTLIDNHICNIINQGLNHIKE